MSRRKPRGLRPEEEDIWRQVARTARPMEGRPKLTKPFTATNAPAPAKQTVVPIAPFEIGAKSETALPRHRLAPSLSEDIVGTPLKMDKKTFGKMKRGKTPTEARIDLHGMTADAAHSALTQFILTAHAAGKRLVLVITGKGREANDRDPIPTRTGVLRHQLPNWLNRPPLRQAVLQVTEAHQRHGGSGAFYVYLARRR
jgi:DNA-nicking Smr family endonuclease